MGTTDLLASARLIGLANSARAVRAAVSRAWIDRGLDPPRGQVRTPGALTGAEPVPGGARLRFEHTSLLVVFRAAGGVFLAWDGASALPSYALAPDAQAPGALAPDALAPDALTPDAPDHTADPAHGWPADASARLEQVGEEWEVRAGEVAVRVDRLGGVAFRMDTGAGVAGHVFRRDAAPWWTGTAWIHRATVEPDATVLGLGGRSGSLDRRGGRYRLWNTEPGGSFGPQTDPLSITMPVYTVTSGLGTHLAFYDVTDDGVVDVADRRGGTVTARLTDGPLRYYVFAGSPAQVVEQFTGLTGRPVVPPRWGLGYHQSRWGYGRQQVLEEIAAGFAEHDLPLSGLWLDIDHLLGHQVFVVDQERFPDLPGLAERLAATGTHLVSIVDPGVKLSPGAPMYEQGKAADAFCKTPRGRLATGVCWPGRTVYPDFTAPAAREWWGEQYARLVENGIDGVWHDMNEPSSFTAFGEPTLPRSTRHDLDGHGGDHGQAHNVYGLCMNRAAYDALRELRPDRRPYVVSRSGWVGMQRYGGAWSGDIETSWAGLRASLAFTLGLSLCGVPYSGPDIGGFTAHPSPELYQRWFQLAAYLPFFRTHCQRSLAPREPWAMGADVLAGVRPHLLERYRLLPYWYTLAWRAHRTGEPYVRPLLWADPGDRALRACDDAFLLGDDVLVAPVLEDGARERAVCLPAGRWYDRRDHVAYDGPATVRVDAPVDQIPVFVRAGAVLPVAEADGVVLEAYRPASTQRDAAAAGTPAGMLITDSGDGYAEPTEETFGIVIRPDGEPTLDYTGPSSALPYPVRWLP